MAWISTVPEEEASGLTAAAYQKLRDSPVFMGRVPNIYKSLSLRPEVLNLFRDLSHTLSFGGSGLSREEEEMISTVVSSLNRCHY